MYGLVLFAQVADLRAPDYRSRSEKPSGSGGAKTASVDEIRWIPVPDVATRVAQMETGELDFGDASSCSRRWPSGTRRSRATSSSGRPSWPGRRIPSAGTSCGSSKPGSSTAKVPVIRDGDLFGLRAMRTTAKGFNERSELIRFHNRVAGEVSRPEGRSSGGSPTADA